MTFRETSRLLLLILGLTWAATPLHAAEYTKADLDQAERAMRALGLPARLEVARERIIQQQIRENPQLSKAEEDLRRFYTRHFNFENLKKQLAPIYLEHFTVAELKALEKFHSSGAGKKLIDKTLDLEKLLATTASGEAFRHKARLEDDLYQVIGDETEVDEGPAEPPAFQADE